MFAEAGRGHLSGAVEASGRDLVEPFGLDVLVAVKREGRSDRERQRDRCQKPAQHVQHPCHANSIFSRGLMGSGPRG